MRAIFFLACIFLFGCSSDDNASLMNKWRLDSFLKSNSSLATNVPTVVFYEFTKDNNLNIDLETNTCSGNYTKEGTNLFLSGFSCDTLCCDSAVSIEAYQLTKDSVSLYEINGNTLKLKGGEGTILQLSLVE